MSNQNYNIQIILLGENEEKDLMKIECFHNHREEITVKIWADNSPNILNLISLDKSTAIKLAKTLRTEINKIES